MQQVTLTDREIDIIMIHYELRPESARAEVRQRLSNMINGNDLPRAKMAELILNQIDSI